MSSLRTIEPKTKTQEWTQSIPLMTMPTTIKTTPVELSNRYDMLDLEAINENDEEDDQEDPKTSMDFEVDFPKVGRKQKTKPNKKKMQRVRKWEWAADKNDDFEPIRVCNCFTCFDKSKDHIQDGEAEKSGPTAGNESVDPKIQKERAYSGHPHQETTKEKSGPTAGCIGYQGLQGGHEMEMIKPIRTIEPENLNTVTEDGMWEEIEMAVDSGATESVVHQGMPSSVPTVPGSASRRGVEYEVANGHRLPNEGEKKFTAITEEGQEKKLVVQVCDVNQGLLSVSKATAANNRVVFDRDGSYIENKDSGEVTRLQEKNGMYILKLWVQRRPF